MFYIYKRDEEAGNFLTLYFDAATELFQFKTRLEAFEFVTKYLIPYIVADLVIVEGKEYPPPVFLHMTLEVVTATGAKVK